MREGLDYELEKLHVDLTKMGHLVDVAVDNMVEAFENQNKVLSKNIITNDSLINDMEKTIESKAFHLILCQQPMAMDLRSVTTALKIVTDLERIGDHASDIAGIVLEFDEQYAYLIVEHIPAMAKKVKNMVHQAIEAFIHKDLTQIDAIKKVDDDVNRLFDKVKGEIVRIIEEHSERIDYCIDFLMIAKYLEKIGDHAVNICEWLEFNQMGTVNAQRLI